MKDYYKILGLDKTASKDEIKKAYRKLSKEHHPDKGGDENKFKEINEAYQVLSDDNKRKQYDNPQTDYYDKIQEQYSAMRDMQRKQYIKAHYKNKIVDIYLSIDELYLGVNKTITYDCKIKCDTCDGKGHTKVETCKTCGGHGKVTNIRNTAFGRLQIEEDCYTCQGTGYKVVEHCKSCNGLGYHINQKSLNINIPRGLTPGQIISLESQGDYITEDIYADLNIRININDNNIKVVNNDLHIVKEVEYTDILNQETIEIDCLDKSKVQIKLKKDYNYSNELRLTKKGYITNSGHIGDLYVKIKINFIIDDEKNKLKKYLDN